MPLIEQLWLVPASTIPGVGLLVLSTSARYMTVALELRNQSKKDRPDAWLSELVYRRARCLQHALLALYTTIGTLVVSSLIFALTHETHSGSSVSAGLMLVGASFLVYATAHLIYEVFMSRQILRRDFENAARHGTSGRGSPDSPTRRSH